MSIGLSAKSKYFLKRILLIPMTLFGIMALNFLFVQLAPGGPVEQMMMKMEQGNTGGVINRISGSGGQESVVPSDDGQSLYRGTQGLKDQLRKELEIRFGFNKPPLERFFSDDMELFAF